jgi:hypothetical protein
LCGCAAPAESEREEPAACSTIPRASSDWGARATPPSDGWIELRASAIASGATPPLPDDCPAAISCSAGLVAESYRFDPIDHTIDFMLKHYGDATLPPMQSAQLWYVLEDGDRGELPFTNPAALAPGGTLHAGGQVGTSTQLERVWARVRLQPPPDRN